MKKIILSVLAIFVILAAAGGVYYYMNLAEPQIEDILPEGALVYMHEKNIAANFAEFSKGEFWQKVSKIDIKFLMEKAVAEPQVIAEFEKVKAHVTDPVTLGLLKKFFGQEFALAVYPTSFSEYNLQALMKVISNVTIVTRLAPESDFGELLNHLAQKFGVQLIPSEVEYKNHNITEVTIPSLVTTKFKLTFVPIKDFLVIGFGDKTTRDAVDVFTKEKKALSKDKNFLNARSNFIDSPHSTGFMNFETLIFSFKDQIMKMALFDTAEEDAGFIKQQFEETFKVMEGFESFSYSSKYGKLSTFKSNFFFDPEKLDPSVKQLYSCRPKKNNSIKFVPKDILSYQWVDCYDLKYYWNEIKKEMAKIPDSSEDGYSVDEAIAGLDNVLGLSMENDILPALGKENGWILHDIDVGGLFPLPKFLFFLQILDQAKAETMMNTFTDQPFLLMQTEQYKGIPIQYVSIPLGVELKPGYCFLGNYLLFGSSQELLKESIDVYNDQSLSLVASPEFKEINFGLTDPSNAVYFFRMGEFMDRVEKVVEWGSNWLLAESQKMEAYRAGSEQRLEDLQGDITEKENKIDGLKRQLDQTLNMKNELQAQGGDTSDLALTVKKLEMQVKTREQDLELAKEKQQELQTLISGYNEDSPDAESMKVLLNHAIYPIIEGLKSIDLIGSKMIMKDGMIESIMYSKTK